MNIKKKLQNPFVLMAQGFIAGAILLWSTTPSEVEANQPSPVQAAALAQNLGA